MTASGDRTRQPRRGEAAVTRGGGGPMAAMLRDPVGAMLQVIAADLGGGPRRPNG